METSNESTGETLFDLTSYAAAIHANPSPRLEGDKVNTTLDTYGLGYEMPLADYDPGTQSWRMFGDTFLSGESPLLETLPPSGMTQNGVLYPQPLWVPLTAETESSLWPTPTASDWKPRGPNSKQQGLPEVVKTRGNLWPTPTARDGKGAANYKSSKRNEADLTNQARAADGVQRGSLNPTWVEWLMGFPPGWTDLED